MFIEKWAPAVFTLLLALGAPAIAQAQGTVNGRVLEGGTLRPMAGVQIVFAGSTLGAITNGDGRFTVPNVPAGLVTVEARTIGFIRSQMGATVVSGRAVRADFVLEAIKGTAAVTLVGTEASNGV